MRAALAAGIFASAITYGVLSHDLMYYVSAIKSLNLSPTAVYLAKFTVAFPASYHVWNGIRHLVRWQPRRASLARVDCADANLACVRTAAPRGAQQAWDTGRFFTLPQVYATGYIVLGLTTASAAFLAYL